MESYECTSSERVLTLFTQLDEQEKSKVLFQLMMIYPKLDEILQRLEVIENKLGVSQEGADIILVEEIPYAEAKDRVKEYLETNETSDIEILHRELHIKIEDLIQIIDELMAEKSIEESDGV